MWINIQISELTLERLEIKNRVEGTFFLISSQCEYSFVNNGRG